MTALAGSIQQLNKSAQWFIDNATEITLLDGQHAYLDDNSGDFKKGDGETLLGNLPWITNDISSIDGGSASASGTTQQLKRDTAANWTSVNPILLSGEQGLETDTGRIKVGTGATWSNTVYSLAPRVTTIASSANPTINVDTTDILYITALATAITSITITGTPTPFQPLIIVIIDDGVARNLNLGSSFEAKGTTIPTTTVIAKALTIPFLYYPSSSKFGCVGSQQEA